jgi:hypothetical protein
MELDALLELVRTEVQHPPTLRRPKTINSLTPTQRAAFRTLQRRMRRERAQGRKLAPPVGSALWV